MKSVLVVMVLATTAFAQPAQKPRPRAVFDGELLAVGTSFNVACGIMMVTQPIEVRVTKVTSGPVKIGEKLRIDVMACFDGPLLRLIDGKGPASELDPAKIRPKSLVHMDVEEWGSDGRWFTTTDRITVKKH